MEVAKQLKVGWCLCERVVSGGLLLSTAKTV